MQTFHLSAALLVVPYSSWMTLLKLRPWWLSFADPSLFFCHQACLFCFWEGLFKSLFFFSVRQNEHIDCLESAWHLSDVQLLPCTSYPEHAWSLCTLLKRSLMSCIVPIFTLTKAFASRPLPLAVATLSLPQRISRFAAPYVQTSMWEMLQIYRCCPPRRFSAMVVAALHILFR